MKKSLMTMLIVFALLQPFGATGYDPSRDGKADLLTALQTAQEHNRLVLVLIGGDWCPPCRVLDRAMAGSEQVQRLISEHYVLVKINYSAENKNKAAMELLPFFIGYPKMFILRSDGSVARSPSLWFAQKAGEFDAAALFELLSEAASKHRGNP